MCTSALLIVFVIATLFALSKDIQSDNALNCVNNENVLYVGGNGPNNYTKIQDAINDAQNGDTVFVYDDSSPYYENIVINKAINLLGENRETTVICGNKDIEKVVIVEANYGNISHFTITTSKCKDIREGILLGNGLKYISVHYVKISDCNFYNFVDAIICCGQSSNITVSNCKFWNSSCAVATGEKSNYIVSNCDIKAWGGIAISGSATVSNCTFHPGKIWIHDGDNNKLINNYIEDGAMQIEYSSHNFLRNNTLVNSGLEVFGHGVEDFHHDIDASNIMQGKPIYYFYDKKDMIIDENSNTGYIILASCQNITVRDLDLYGSVLAFSSNNSFENCSFWGNSVGIYLHNSTYNSIHKCHFENYYPLMIEQSCRNNVSYCTFSGPYVHNIEIWHSSNENTVVGCTLNGNGIYLGDAYNNTIVKCSISNSSCGIEIDGNDNVVNRCNITQNELGAFVGGRSNKIFLNNFINNNRNAFCYGLNIWNTREGGNYWDDYRGFDLNKDGIGELPYHVKTDIQAIPLYMESFFNFDWRPLMYPVKTL